MKREAYQEQIAQVSVGKLVFLDECGFSLALYRLYGWVIGGGRCIETVPFHLQRGQAHSVVGALSLPPPDCPRGLRALWQKAGTWNRASFEAFLQDGLLPVLQPGSVLVLDNARFHHASIMVGRFRRWWKTRGARCSICRLTHPTSIPSNCSGAGSKPRCAS